MPQLNLLRLRRSDRTDDDGGWKHSTTGIGNRSGKLISRNQKRSDSFYEDLPDISLAGDRVYGVFSQGSRPARSSNAVPSPGVENMQNPLGRISLSGGFQQLAIAPAPAPAPTPTPAPTPAPRERTRISIRIDNLPGLPHNGPTTLTT